MMFFGCYLSNVNSLKFIAMNNQECKKRPEIVINNSDEPTFYPYSVKVSKCSSNCNNINDPYTKMCIHDVVKNMNLKVFNLKVKCNKIYKISWKL